MHNGSKKYYIKESTKPEGEKAMTEISKYFKGYSYKCRYIGSGFKSYLSHI